VIYLDAIVSSRKNGVTQEDELRRKFQRFLQESNLYRAQTVLAKIKGMGLDQETATLYGKVRKTIDKNIQHCGFLKYI
jgi:hypothetical protein